MTAIRFLTVERVLNMQFELVRLYGGDPGVRNLGLIEAAMAMPRQSFGGELMHPSLAAMAAAYFFHLTANHGFVDGNKRIGVASALLFLELNGHHLHAAEDVIEALSRSVASGTSNKRTVVEFFEKHVREGVE